MNERFRLFKGSTELNYSVARFVKSNDDFVNTAYAEIEAESAVSAGVIVDFMKVDGSTAVFSPRVTSVKKGTVWKVGMASNGWELIGLKVEQVYTDKSPEYIVKDIVDSLTSNLTYASTGSSGVTISGNFIANGYAIDIIRKMMDILKWQIRIDENDNFYFEKFGVLDNGVVFTEGDDFHVEEWDDDNIEGDYFNRVKVIGAQVTNSTTETVTGTGTSFTLTEKPLGNVRVTISGTELAKTSATEPYVVDPENKKVVFTSSRTNPSFSYEFLKPINVDYTDDDAVSDYGGIEVFKQVQAPELDTYAACRQLAKSLVGEFSRPAVKGKGSRPGFWFDVDVGEKVSLVDNFRGKSTSAVITRIEYDAGSGQTFYWFGRPSLDHYMWRSEVEKRIKKLEMKVSNSQDDAFCKVFKHDLDVTLTLSGSWQWNSPENSFVLGHQTLGRLRSGLDFEADCSDNGLNGSWSGTGVTSGSQFSSSGHRLYCGIFNGSDRYVTVSDDAALRLNAGNWTVSFAMKVSSLPSTTVYVMGKRDAINGWAVKIKSDNVVYWAQYNVGVEYLVNSGHTLVVDEWVHLTFVNDNSVVTPYVNGVAGSTGGKHIGSYTGDLTIGKYLTNFFSGFLDELMIFSKALSASEVSDVYNKIFVSDSLEGYWSFDDPVLGDNFSARQDV